MNLFAHIELSWLAAQVLPTRRDRIIATVAGVAPDVDALALLGGTRFYGTYHHVLTHGYVAAIATALVAAVLARGRPRTALVALATFHLHLLCDLAGSGPGWPIVYFWPTSSQEWFWRGQWDLASWQNGAIVVGASLACLAMALPLRRTVLELVSLRADRAMVRAIWQRFRPGRMSELGAPPPAQ